MTVKLGWDSGGPRLVLGMPDYDRRRRWSQATLGGLGEKSRNGKILCQGLLRQYCREWGRQILLGNRVH